MVSRLHQILENVIDLCFPPSEEVRHVRTLTPADMDRISAPNNLNGVVTLAPFNNPSIRALIHEAKFHNNAQAQTLLAYLVQNFLVTRPVPGAVWIPIPLSRPRLRARGYNQVEKVLNALPDHLKPAICPDILIRTRDTPPQTELDRAARLANMDGAFTVQEPSLVNDQNIILIDDVLTTGATLQAAKTALLPHAPRSITLLALAH